MGMKGADVGDFQVVGAPAGAKELPVAQASERAATAQRQRRGSPQTTKLKATALSPEVLIGRCEPMQSFVWLKRLVPVILAALALVGCRGDLGNIFDIY